MVDIILHSIGETIAVGFSSQDRNEVLCQYYSLWNLKATNGRLIWMNGDSAPYFAFCWSTQTLFNKWLKDSSARIYGNSVPCIKKFWQAKKAIRNLITQRSEAIRYEHFLPSEKAAPHHYVSGLDLDQIVYDLEYDKNQVSLSKSIEEMFIPKYRIPIAI